MSCEREPDGTQAKDHERHENTKKLRAVMLVPKAGYHPCAEEKHEQTSNKGHGQEACSAFVSGHGNDAAATRENERDEPKASNQAHRLRWQHYVKTAAPDQSDRHEPEHDGSGKGCLAKPV
jgi:hypothetical protein